MSVSKEDIKKISNLVSIEIEDKDIEKYQKDLSDVLHWTDNLNNADTSSIKDVFDDNICTPLRDDTVKPSGIDEEIRKAFVSREKDLAKVKKVI